MSVVSVSAASMTETADVNGSGAIIRLSSQTGGGDPQRVPGHRHACPALYQFGKFFLVGGFNFLLDAAILNFFLFATKLTAGLPQTGFKSASFFWGAISSYLWNKYWTFSGGPRKNKGKEIYQFLAVTLTSFALNVGLDYVFVNMVGSFWNMKPILWAQFSAVLAAAIAMFWNFLGYKFIVFKVKTAETVAVEEDKKIVLAEMLQFDKK